MDGFTGWNYLRKYFEISFMEFMKMEKYEFTGLSKIFGKRLSKYFHPKYFTTMVKHFKKWHKIIGKGHLAKISVNQIIDMILAFEEGGRLAIILI